MKDSLEQNSKEGSKEYKLQQEIERIVQDSDNFELAKSNFETEIKTKYNLAFEVDDNVFPPFYFDISLIMAEVINNIWSEGKVNIQNLLAIGVGSEIDFVPIINSSLDNIQKTSKQSPKNLPKKLSRLYGTDINPLAIQNTNSNFAFLGNSLKNSQPQIFLNDRIPNELKNNNIDLAWWNIPFFGKKITEYRLDQNQSKHYWESRFDENHNSLRIILTDLKNILVREGKLVLMYSEFGVKDIERIIQDAGFFEISRKNVTVKECIRQKLPVELQFEVFIVTFELSR